MEAVFINIVIYFPHGSSTGTVIAKEQLDASSEILSAFALHVMRCVWRSSNRRGYCVAFVAAVCFFNAIISSGNTWCVEKVIRQTGDTESTKCTKAVRVTGNITGRGVGVLQQAIRNFSLKLFILQIFYNRFFFHA